MTDPRPPAEPGPVDPDVELASAHLDGESGADERARAGDGAVPDHVAALRRVSEQVRSVPPPPPGLVDDQVARAMEGFPAQERVVPLDRARTRPWWERIPLGAVAAAVVVVALIGALGLASTTDDDDTDTAATALDSVDDTSAEGSGGESSADDSEAAAGGADESTALGSGERFDGAGDPPSYESYDALAEDLRTELADGSGAEPPTEESDVGTTAAPERSTAGDAGSSSDPCGAVGVLGLDPADVVLVRDVVVAPDEVTVVVHDADDGRRLTVIDEGTCAVTVDRLL